MKKSSLFVIAVVCVLAIVIITFFGQAVEMGQFSNPIKTITITNTKTNNIISIDYDKEKNFNGVAELLITYKITPEEPDDPNAIRFTLENNVKSNGDKIAEIDDYGRISFYTGGFITVRITATDGGGAEASCYVYCAKADDTT